MAFTIPFNAVHEGRQSYTAGGRQPKLTLEGAIREGTRSPQCYWSAFAPGGAQLARRGSETVVRITQPGEARVAILVRADRFRQVEGHTPKVWKESTSRCEGGLLLVAAPGFELEIAEYKRPFRRFRIAPSAPNGPLVPVDQEVSVID